MKWKWLWSIALVALVTACAENNTNIFGPTMGTGGGIVPTADQSIVQTCQLAPSSVRIKNGEDARVKVRTFAAGGIEVIVWPVTSSIQGDQVVSIEPSTASSNANRELILLAKFPGDATLVVHVGTATCSADVTVLEASPA